MNPTAAVALARDPALSDLEVVERVRAGEIALYEILMRRHDRLLYRALRAFLRDEAEIEDVMQQAWVRAYGALAQFRGEARFSTWLVRIALNEARGRLRRQGGVVALAPAHEDGEPGPPAAPAPGAEDPEALAIARELLTLTERAVDQLPAPYRAVFVLRVVEGLETAETAAALGVSVEVVKTRLHRAREALRERLAADVERTAPEAFPFHAPRCDRLVAAVLEAIAGGRGDGASPPRPPPPR
jgi:RNA polymerase sigma-70 factor (ECF subfamily)